MFLLVGAFATTKPLKANAQLLPATGRIHVRASEGTPPATVVIDGANAGTTPTSLDVEPGRHTLQLRFSDGTLSELRAITIREQDTRTFVLGRAAASLATLTVAIAPDDGHPEVHIDDELIGVAPLRTRVSPGEHTVRIRWPTGRIEQRTILFSAGGEFKLRPRS